MAMSTRISFLTLLLVTFTLGLMWALPTSAETCEIPESGPWPPCATGETQKPEIIRFWTEPALAMPDEPLELHWETTADYVIVSIRTERSYTFLCGEGTPAQPPKCPPIHAVSINPNIQRTINLSAFLGENGVSKTLLIECNPDAWLFTDTGPRTCPNRLPQYGPMQLQYFEKGFMLGAVGDQIRFLQYGGAHWQYFEWPDTTTPNKHAALTPPSGRYKPTGALAEVWDVETMGWATQATATDYDGYVQAVYIQAYSSRYDFTAPNDMYYRLSSSLSSYEWQVLDRELSPPYRPNSAQPSSTCVIPDSGPWPPCATGGNPPSAPPTDCVIPESGPWPPCAR